jgi:hypothetical protein
MKPDKTEALYSQYYDQGEKIRAEHMERYSYRFTARFLTIGSKYKLFELLPVKGDRPAEFCFLTVDKSQGVMIPSPFHEHRLKLLARTAVPPPKKLIPKTAFQPAPQQKVNPHPDKSNGKEPGSALPKEEGKPAAVDRWAI